MCDAKRNAKVEHSENVERAHEEPSVAEWPRLKAEGDKEDEEAQRRKSEMSLKELEGGKSNAASERLRRRNWSSRARTENSWTLGC